MGVQVPPFALLVLPVQASRRRVGHCLLRFGLPMHLPLLLLAAFVAGAVNSIAGGGTLLTFPSLLAAHIPALSANATNTVALVPASLSAFFGYRATRGNPQDLAWFAIPSLAGGLAGALVLVGGGDRFFSRLVPWLVLSATVLFILQEPLRRWSEWRRGPVAFGPPTRRRRLFTASLQFLIALYGGFFGAGMGILMLATMGMMGIRDIHEMNRLKNICAAAINGVAAVTFAVAGQVRWTLALSMAAVAVVGGYLGAQLAQKISPTSVRRVVIAVGISAFVWTLARPL